MANKTKLENVEIKIPNSNAFIKKTDYTTEISGIKNDYVTSTSLTSQLDHLKTTHIADEVKKVDDKVTKSRSEILALKVD